jgi:hypothetical protein
VPPIRRENPIPPLVQAVTTDSLPLLATLLAGFSASTVVALLLSTSIDVRGGEADAPIQIALALQSLSILALLAATSFAVWGRAYDYRHLTKEAREILNITAQGDELERYFLALHREWQFWHRAAAVAYCLGLTSFLLGKGLLLYALARPEISVVSGSAVAAIVVLTVAFFAGAFRGKR